MDVDNALGFALHVRALSLHPIGRLAEGRSIHAQPEGVQEMNNGARNENKGHAQEPAVELVILELLRSYGVRPGDSIDIYRMQEDMGRKGVDIRKFSAGIVQLLDRGVFVMRSNLFRLSGAGFEVLKSGKGGEDVQEGGSD